MYSLKNDYSEGAHPRILEALVETNLKQEDGYGEDKYCKEAIRLLKEKMNNENVDIHFITGGTQTNLLATASFLRPYEACISANSGHIYVNEAGAIECTGHKIIAAESNDGKIKAEDIVKIVKAYNNMHVVKPRLVYISNSTEVGTIYKRSELESLSKVCRENDLILYMDGARLGSALSCEENDLTLEDISRLTDAFYIGATKNGALLGEAMVICNDKIKDYFILNMKQRGALLAKGRVLGIQFVELFKDNLFFDLAKYANELSDILRDGISELGYKYLVDSPSNQIFPIFPKDIVEKLRKEYDFSVWEEIDENNLCIRLITAWATKKEEVEGFVEYLRKISCER